MALVAQRKEVDLEMEFYQADPSKAPMWLKRKAEADATVALFSGAVTVNPDRTHSGTASTEISTGTNPATLPTCSAK